MTRAPWGWVMRTAKIQKLIFGVILVSGGLMVGMKLYGRYRPMAIYVARSPAFVRDLAPARVLREQGFEVEMVESPYQSVPEHERPLTLDQVEEVRSAMVWKLNLTFMDSLTIVDSTHVFARRDTRRSLRKYHLTRLGNEWSVESVERERTAATASHRGQHDSRDLAGR